MAATISVNGRTVVHAGSDGVVMFAPDVCLTPTPGGPVPIPYPNIAKSSDTAQGSKEVSMDGNPIMLQGSVFSTSTGDEAGSNGGVASGVTKGKAEFIMYSFDVQVEGKPVPRLGDQMLGNKGGSPNTPPAPEMQPPSIVVSVDVTEKDKDKLVIKVLNPEGDPVKDVKYILRKPDGTEEEGTTSSSGEITLDNTIRGSGKILFPENSNVTLKHST